MKTKNVSNQILEILQSNPTISYSDLSKILNVAKSTIQYHMNKLGIKRDRIAQQKINNTCREKRLDINQDAEQIILGSILGDGCISKYRKPKDTKLLLNSTLTIVQGIKQKDYLEYKKELLERNNIKCTIKQRKLNTKPRYIKGVLLKEYPSFSLTTCRNVVFNKYRDIFYNSRKHLSKYLYKLNALGLAIWYMDDGYCSQNSINFCTNCFTYKEVQLLQTILKHNFDLETTVHKSNLGHPIIHIRAKSRKRFIDLVSPYICECLKYKLGT